MVTKLLEEIAEIEAQAGAVDATDKVALYDLLIVAYFKAKDTIEALQTMAPEPVVTVDTDEVDKLTYALAEATKLLAVEQTAIELFKATEAAYKINVKKMLEILAPE